MPKCISCNEVYADQLRRCPHCGFMPEPTPADAKSAGASAGGRLRRRAVAPMRLVLLAAIAGAAALAAAVGWPSSGSEQVPEVIPAVPRPLDPLEEPIAIGLPTEIEPQPIERDLQVTEARIEGADVVVWGTCSPLAVVEVRVNGRRATIVPEGNRFRARVPREGDVVEIRARGIRGDEASLTREIAKEEAAGGEAEDVRLLDRANGVTLHAAQVELAYATRGGSGPARRTTVPLPNVENRLVIEGSRFVLYRAPEGLVYLRTTPDGVRTFLRKIDDQEMVLVSGGISRRGTGTEPPHGPEHLVEISAFLIDRREVTCLQYARFLRATRGGLDVPRFPGAPESPIRPVGWRGDDPPPGSEALPVTGISWYAANAYARWVGGRMPTESEWERAAAGPMGSPYPWGPAFDPARCRVSAAGPVAADSLPGGAGFYGLLHASGNVREWCHDRFDPRWYLRGSRRNPRGPLQHTHRVVRGGSFLSSPDAARLQLRDHLDANGAERDVGFRVARAWSDVDPPESD